MDKLRELVAEWTQRAKNFRAEHFYDTADTIEIMIGEFEAALASLPAAAGRDPLSAEPIEASASSSPSVGIGPKQKCPRCGEPRACYSCGVMFEDDLGLID